MLVTLREKRLIVPAVMAAVALPVLVSLGLWQLERKAWKEGIISALATRAADLPVTGDAAAAMKCTLSQTAGVLASCDYIRVELEGTFDHSGERHIFAGAQKIGGASVPGYWVFTPFLSTGTAPAKPILVNRGFVPAELKSAAAREAGQIKGVTKVLAHIRSRETRRWFDAENRAETNTYYVRDPAELGLAYETPIDGAPVLDAGYFYLEAVGTPPEGGFPRPLAGEIQLTNRHLEYALTWFGLAAAFAAVFAVYALSRFRS